MRIFTTAILLCVCAVFTAFGQTPREDYVWARTSATPITVDGVLDEPGWATAESIRVVYGQYAGLPGSGWHQENSADPTDPTDAVVKFLMSGDSLYVAFIVKDSSVGAGGFNRKDGVLMNLRDKNPTGSPGVFINSLYSRSFEFFYAWWDNDTTTRALDAQPAFFGFVGGHRDSIQAPRADYPDVDGLVKRVIWDAMTTVQGQQNSDTTAGGAPAFDEGYTMEIKMNVGLRGYNPSVGDTIMWSVSIYDADWRWPIDSTRMRWNRVWLQGPFGNAAQRGHLNILAGPNVTTTSGPVPATPGPDMLIPNGQDFATPVIDGVLDDEVWQYTPTITMEYGNDMARNSYPNAGKYRSGQYQLPIDGNTASVLDINPVTVRYLFKGDTLYFGFDVPDQVVSYRTAPDHRDGFRITINDRVRVRGTPLTDQGYYAWDIRFFVDTLDHGAGRGWAGPLQNTLELDTLGAIKYALQLKPNTDVDTLEADPGANPDQGYTAEVAIDLTQIGYAAGRGDGVAFFGITHYDGDFFTSLGDSYSIRTWFFRELNDLDGPVWAYMDPAYLVTTNVADVPAATPMSFELLGNYPNPFNPSTVIRYTMPEQGSVILRVFDLLGRKVAEVKSGMQLPGVRQFEFVPTGLSSGAYFYYLEMTGTSKNVLRTAASKMLLVK